MAATVTAGQRSIWTPRDVARALESYVMLAADTAIGMIRAVRLDDGVYCSSGHSPIENSVARKADIDLAVARLPRHIERVMRLYFLEGLHSCRYVANELHISKSTVAIRRRRGISSVAADLCNSDRAGSEVWQYIS